MKLSNNKTALILGATGATGSELTQLLSSSSDYSKVILLHYRATGIDLPKVEDLVLDFKELDNLDLGDVTIDEVYCCIGTTIAKAGSLENYERIDRGYVLTLAKRMKSLGTTSFSFISSVGANAKSGNYYLRIKGEAEAGLKDIGFTTLFIYQAGALFGLKREEFRWKEILLIPILKCLNAFLIGGLGKYKMTHIHTLAICMINQNNTNKTGTQVILANQITSE